MGHRINTLGPGFDRVPRRRISRVASRFGSAAGGHGKRVGERTVAAVGDVTEGVRAGADRVSWPHDSAVGCRPWVQAQDAPPGFGGSPGEGIALRPFTAAMTKTATRQRFPGHPYQ